MMALHPYFADEDKQQFLEKLARGKPGAVSRPGAGISIEREWFPAIDGEAIFAADGGLIGHKTKAAAKDAATKFRDECRTTIAQVNGDL